MNKSNKKNGSVFANASWIIIGKIIQSFLTIFITMLTARYLGPGKYGLINYAASLVAFVSPIVFLGLNNTLVNELSNNEDDDGVILGTSIILCLISSFFCMFGILCFSFFLNAGDIEVCLVSFIYSFILIFQVLDLVNYWFQNKLWSKYPTIVTLIAYVIVAIYKIFILLNGSNIYLFALANVIDYLIISVSLLFLYFKFGGTKLSFSFSLSKKMLKRSSPYILTGLMIAIFAQTDKIMLKFMINEEATGFYSAAVSCASMTGFVFAAIIDSFRPVIFKYFKKSNSLFELNIIRLYSLIIYLSFFQSIFMTILSRPIILILYGQNYLPSINALMIITWFVTFSYLGSVRGIWILSNNLQKYLIIINFSGAILNVIMNLILIPRFGINGAAFASLFTQFFTNFLINFIIAPIRNNNKLIIKSLNPKYIYLLVRERMIKNG